MELHDENPFKIRGFNNALFKLEQTADDLSSMTLKSLETIEGVGKSIAASIDEINRTGKLTLLEELIDKTPPGVIDMLGIKGIGPKKIRLIWKSLEIETIDALKEACNENRIASLKGFGKKTQENILEALQYKDQNVGKFHYAAVLPIANSLKEAMEKKFPEALVAFTGDLRRKIEVICCVELLIGIEHHLEVPGFLNQLEHLQNNAKISGPFIWRGAFLESGLEVIIRHCSKEDFYNNLLKHTGSTAHLSTRLENGDNLIKIICSHKLESEQQAYEIAGLPYIEPEMREGLCEYSLVSQGQLPEKLIEVGDIRGIIHNHSTYSDGKHSLREMAEHCRDLGYEYLGISDHSKSAFYANGLKEDKIVEQHSEIDALNLELAPFKIFKGIESDILSNGDLDYSEAVLGTFDFIVTSIHSGFVSDVAKNTERLLKAIRNPYTTILGHPTGRLLLKREGYPIDHAAVIDACAEHNVIIEINANPKRLDLDWRWVHYALAKNVMLSVNPDAHSKEEYQNMKFGVAVGRKGGLTKERTLNCLSLAEVSAVFNQKKVSI